MNSRTSTTSKNHKKTMPKNNMNNRKVSSATNSIPKKKVVKTTTSNNVSQKKNNTKNVIPNSKKKNVNKKLNTSTNNRPIKKTTNINQNQNVKVVKKSNPTQIKKEKAVDNTLNIIDVAGFENYNEEYIPKKPRVENRKEIVNEKNEENKKASSLKFLAFTFIIGIATVCGYLMFTLEYFDLANIQVKGNTKYTSEKVVNNCSLNIGQNVFKQLIKKEYNKSELPYVSKIKYLYSFPDTIIIDVEERYPEYISKDKNTDKYYMIDNQGYLLEECTLEQKRDELLVEGLVFEENVQFGKKIDDVYIKKIERFREIKKLVEEAEISTNITKVNFNASLTIITIDDKLNVVFSNDSVLGYKVSFLKQIINQNGGIVEGTIDMSMENPIYSKYY